MRPEWNPNNNFVFGREFCSASAANATTERPYYGDSDSCSQAMARAADDIGNLIASGVRAGDIIYFRRARWSKHDAIAARSLESHKHADYGHVLMVVDVGVGYSGLHSHATLTSGDVTVAHATVHGSLLRAALGQLDSTRSGPMIESLFDLLLEESFEQALTRWTVLRPYAEQYSADDLAVSVQIARRLDKRGSFRVGVLAGCGFSLGRLKKAYAITSAPASLDYLPPQTAFICTGFIDYLLTLGRLWNRTDGRIALRRFAYAYRLTPGHLMENLSQRFTEPYSGGALRHSAHAQRDEAPTFELQHSALPESAPNPITIAVGGISQAR